MLPNCAGKLPPIADESGDTDRDQEHREIRFVEESETSKETDKERVSQCSILIPGNREVKTGAPAEKARNRNAPIQHRKEKKRRIKSEQDAGDQRCGQAEPAPGAQHEEKHGN